MKRFLLCIGALAFSALPGLSQNVEEGTGKAVTYKTIFDDPTDVYKLWIGFQPLYTDLFVTNISAGFGIQANYYHENKFDCKFQARKAYAEAFDHNRDLAHKNDGQSASGPAVSINYSPAVFTYFELSGTYHVVDAVAQGKAKIILYSRRYKDWASTVPQYIWVPAQVRKIYGVRLGALAFNATTNLQRAMEVQNATIQSEDGLITRDYNSGSLFGNVHTKAIFIGGSASRIKNIAVKPDKGFGVLLNDLIITGYFDIMIAPQVKIDDVILNDVRYSTKSIKTKSVGARLGLDGLFNREFSWSYGAEIGFRPSVASGGFYALLKLGFPVFGTRLSQQREAFGK